MQIITTFPDTYTQTVTICGDSSWYWANNPYWTQEACMYVTPSKFNDVAGICTNRILELILSNKIQLIKFEQT